MADLKDLQTLKSYEALEECVRRDTPEVASALHLSLSQVNKWKEPPYNEDVLNSGARNPLDRLEILIETIEKIDPLRAHLPVRWLAARFGYVLSRVPGVHPSDKDLFRALLDCIKGFGDVASEGAKALKEGEVTRADYERVYREGLKLVEAIFVFLAKMKGRTE